jgi:hypothetical protein
MQTEIPSLDFGADQQIGTAAEIPEGSRRGEGRPATARTQNGTSFHK